MENTLYVIQEEIVEPIEPVVMKKRGRPLNTFRSDRHLEDGTYNHKPLDPDWAKKYYLEKLKDVNVICPNCGVSTSKVNVSRHVKSYKCKYNALLLKPVVEASDEEAV